MIYSDCDYRYNINDDLYCKNKGQPNPECDNCKENIHLNCQNYVPRNDMCLSYFELGFHNISEYNHCVEKEAYPDG